MNMLCGFTRPSSGNAFMYGLSIRNDMTELRDMMGVCPQVCVNGVAAFQSPSDPAPADTQRRAGVPARPRCPSQHDILFADLTALEHIELFCGIKNIPAETIPRLARERLEAVRLWKVRFFSGWPGGGGRP